MEFKGVMESNVGTPVSLPESTGYISTEYTCVALIGVVCIADSVLVRLKKKNLSSILSHHPMKTYKMRQV